MSGTEPEAHTAPAEQPPVRPGDADPKATRWTRVCAWNGHELADMDFLQVSAHERVCRFHHPQFQTWLHDASQRMYRAVGADDGADREDHPVPAST